MNSTIFIGGPTASGKSRLALMIAERLAALGGARIINADSMQVYSELRIVTARPSIEDVKRVCHRLFGVLSVSETCSAGRWRDWALKEVAAAHRDRVVPILVGGTGLYFRALLRGLAPIPDVPLDIRAEARRRVESLAGLAEMASDLAAAGHTKMPTDSQRIARAWEVLEATGESLETWQSRGSGPRLVGPTYKLVLLPERTALYRVIDRRVSAMPNAGVLDEILALNAQHLEPGLPALRAVGVQEFKAAALGEIALSEAINRVQRASRRYAKRQYTWFRKYAGDWTPVTEVFHTQFSETFDEEIFPNILEFLLTESD